MNSNTATELRTQLQGELIRPDDAGYEDARQVWNGMIDRHPSLIARCASVDDVIAAVNYGRDNGLPIAVRGGGHNVSGNAVCDDGLVIDLSKLRDVQVDAAARRVRTAGGATIGDVDRATQEHGLAVPLGLVSKTGVAGLTLGGGLSWLRRAHGLACDNLVAADVVTAAGTLVRASADENSELLWGLRGGGGNFGVVTSFEYRAHPVGPDVFVTLVFHPWQDAEAALRHYREWSESAPDEVSAIAILWHAPAIDAIPVVHHHQPVVTLAAICSGDPAEGKAVVAPLREFGQPIADLSETMPYVTAQQLFDDDYPAHELRYYWKSLYLTGVDHDALNVMMELNEACPSPHSNLDLWQLGGAFARVGAEETSFGDRSAPFLLGIEANWEYPADDDANIEWARRAYSALRPFSTGGEYLNFPGFYEEGERTLRTTFGPNYQRLASLKQQYDPANLFRLNQNIQPTSE